jgi:SAM-dependent methyltransferase
MRFHEDDSLRRELLGRIPLAARVVLDVGCGDGALAADYRRLNPRALIFGIEGDRHAAVVAAPHLDGIARVSVVDEPLPFDVPQGVDCILYRGVLEHLVDPRALLLAHAAVLNDDGTMLICLPNPDYWRHQERSLHGGGNREEPGLRSLPRRLSIEAMAEYLGSVGLQLGAVYPIEADAVEAAAFASAMTPALLALGIDPQAYSVRSSPAYFVWCVRKTPLQLLTVAASMLEPVGGVSHVRIMEPLQAMATDPSVFTYLSPGGDRDRIDAHSPRIFVLHRPALTGEAGLGTIRALLRDDWLIVTEFDDHPDFFEIMRGEGQFSFAGVHAVQTSTDALASVLRLRNPEVAVFPNAIRELPEPRNFAGPDAITIFFGALNREPDWAPLIATLNSVASWAGDRLRFCVLHDRGFFDALETPHKVFTPVCDYDTYVQLLGGCEISFMPLLDTPFNRAKSDLKFIEAGACRVVPLASDIVYAGSIEDGVTGLLFRDADELRTRLLRLITMPHMALDLANTARSHVAAHRMLAYQVAPRIRWYRSLWDRKTELTNALETRLRLAGVD